MVNRWKNLKYILICLHWMNLTWVIELCKNVFAINNGIIVLTLHEQDLTKGCDKGLYGPWARPVIFPMGRTGLANEKRFFQRAGRAGKWKAIFPTGRAGPAIERWFFQRAGPGRQIKGDFSNGPGRRKRNEFGPGPGLKNRPLQTFTPPLEANTPSGW